MASFPNPENRNSEKGTSAEEPNPGESGNPEKGGKASNGKTENDTAAPMASLARYSEIGFIIPAAVILGFFLGKVADYYLHTKWLYIVGLIFGAIVGFVQMIRMATDATKDQS